MTVFQAVMNLIGNGFLSFYNALREVTIDLTPTVTVSIMDIMFTLAFLKIAYSFVRHFTKTTEGGGRTKAGE